MRIAGIIGNAQRVPSPSELTDALACLNAMIDEWLTQRLFVYRVQQNIQNVNPNQASYQIGPGAPDWNVPFRPVRIEFADLIQILNQSEPPTYLPLAILNAQDWFSIAVPSITSSTPQKLYYEPTVPLGTVHLWPVPQVSNQIALGLWTQVHQFSLLTDTVSFPPGYLKALQYNLANELGTRPWAGPVTGISPVALAEAERSKMWVKSMNRPTMDMQMRCEGAAQGIDVRGRWDITTNQWRWS